MGWPAQVQHAVVRFEVQLSRPNEVEPG
jgi:hypothetical protein